MCQGIQHVFNQLDLVRHLGTSKNGKEGALGVIEGLGRDKVTTLG